MRRPLIAALTVVLVVAGCSLGEDDGISIEEASTFVGYDVYYAGESFEGHELTAIHRRPNYLSVKYGSCRPSSDAGCAIPLELQQWPLCERNPSVYSLPAERWLSIRRTPAVLYIDRLEVYTGGSAVVLFGHSRAQLLRAARALRGLNNPIQVGDPLPRPPEGALEGLPC